MTPNGLVLSTGARGDRSPVQLTLDRPLERGDVLTIASKDREIVFIVQIVEDGVRVEALDPEALAWNDDETGDTIRVTPNIEFTYP